MQHLVDNLKDISVRITTAQQSHDYVEILRLDQYRKSIINEIFSVGVKQLSEENFDIIKSIAEENEKMISEISKAGTKNAEAAHKRMKAIKGYKE